MAVRSSLRRRRTRGGAGDLRHLQRVGQPRGPVVALRREEALRLVLHPAEGLAVQDAVAVARGSPCAGAGLHRPLPIDEAVVAAGIGENISRCHSMVRSRTSIFSNLLSSRAKGGTVHAFLPYILHSSPFFPSARRPMGPKQAQGAAAKGCRRPLQTCVFAHASRSADAFSRRMGQITSRAHPPSSAGFAQPVLSTPVAALRRPRKLRLFHSPGSRSLSRARWADNLSSSSPVVTPGLRGRSFIHLAEAPAAPCKNAPLLTPPDPRSPSRAGWADRP